VKVRTNQSKKSQPMRLTTRKNTTSVRILQQLETLQIKKTAAGLSKQKSSLHIYYASQQHSWHSTSMKW